MKIKKGFTLIELLLVTGIISLVMSVVFFQVTEAKKKAEDTHMVAESAQVSRAVYQYKDDHNGFVPRPTSSSGPDYSGEYAESDPEYAQSLQPLVTGGYLPSIPYSPNGTGYTYIISEDGKEAVFAANLNNARSGGSRKNSCELVSNVETPPPVTTYGTCSLVPTGTCVPSATIACFTISNSPDAPTLPGEENMGSTLNTYCDAYPNTLYPQYVNIFPSNLCQIGTYTCSMPNWRTGTPSVCIYQISWPNTQEEYACNYTTTTSEPDICSGSTETEYCECL